jgi:hypothetical protein
MKSTFGLNLVNIGGEITGLGSTATVQAGHAATIINGAGGEIGAGIDSAIAAAEDLGLENLGRIASGGRSATIDAGANAGITNGDGGQITNRVGSAITATIGLTLVNQPGGTISGGARYTVDAGIMADVTNRGTITGLPDGILLGPASRLTNAPGGLIEGIDTAIAAADGSIRIVNEPGARIRSTLAETIRFGRGVGHDFINMGRVSADRGPALDVTEVLRFRLDNTRLGEITSRSAEAIVIRRTQETQLVNDGALEAELEAIAQSGGRLDLTNRPDGSIRSDSATAVVAEVLRLENAAGASIVGETGGIRMDSGSVDNEGRIEAAGTAAAIFVEASAETAQVTNRGVVSGGAGIRFDADHSGTREVTNAGTITAFDGVAIDFAAGLGQSLLRVQGSSRILGDVRFGASDDILEIGDITAGQLIDGRFEGGGGMDLVRFGTHDLASDAMSFVFHDGVMVEIAFRAGNGDAVSGQFRDFEFFDFGGGPRSFAELQGMGSDPLAPIPVPAALPMLLAGIAAFLGLRRRGARRAAAI